ncbi:MAG: hypothetical protein ABUL63_00065, partial [Acidobacteriota bacterium]
TLFRILAEFKVGIGEFFEDVAREDVARESITPRDVQLVQQFSSLPEDAQKEVESFIAFKRAQSLQGESRGTDHHDRHDRHDRDHFDPREKGRA